MNSQRGFSDSSMNIVFPADDKVATTDEKTDVHRKLTSSLDDKATDNNNSILAGRHSWFSYKAIRKREYGASNYRSPDWFCYKAMGSLHMVHRFELMSKLECHNHCINCLHFNASGTRLLSGSDLDVCVWDWALHTPVSKFDSGHRNDVLQAKFMPHSGDRRIVTCAVDGEVRLTELTVQGVCTRKLANHEGVAYKLALELDSPHVFLTCGQDGVVYEVDLRDSQPNKLLVCTKSTGRDRKIPLYSIHSHPLSPHYFAVCGHDRYNRIYDKRRISDAVPLKKLCPEHLVNENFFPVDRVYVVWFSITMELLASYNNDDIFLFDVSSNAENSDKVVRRYTGHNSTFRKSVNFYGPNSEYVVIGSDCRHIYFWDTKMEEVVQFLPNDEQEGENIYVLEPHPTTAFLAMAGYAHDVKIWAPTKEEPKYDRKMLNELMQINACHREFRRGFLR